ncbi:MAG: mechanosensitive ion channel [Magnetococcales bacterium]|nr:mechanosensitive ion channel [Magnetococcales bacterium]
MMDNASWIVLSSAVVLSVLLVATLITIPLRRLSKSGGEWGKLFAVLSLPLAVLALSSILLALLFAFPAAFGPLRPERKHLEAWYLFWGILLLFNLSEGIGRLYHTHFQRDAPPAHGILYFLGRLFIVGISLLLVLQFAMDLNASQLLTSTAVVATMVGFALREVLSNFLAGLSVQLVGTVQPTQWIAIGDKEGEIIQRNWRETRIRSTGGHIYIIPNSTVANSVITHMTWDAPLRRHAIDIPVDYLISPAVVCQALREAAASVPEVDQSHKKPDAMISACRESAMIYRVRFWSRTFHDRSHIEGAVRERVWYQLQRYGIRPGAITEIKVPDLTTAIATNPVPADLAPGCYELLLGSGFVHRFLQSSTGQMLVDESALRTFAALLRRRLYGQGEVLFSLGESGYLCYIHVRGVLHGRTELVALLGDQGEFKVEVGDWVGEITVFSGLPRTATLYVKEGDVEVLEVSSRAFHYLLSCHEEIARIFYQRLAQRSKKMMEALHPLKIS